MCLAWHRQRGKPNHKHKQLHESTPGPHPGLPVVGADNFLVEIAAFLRLCTPVERPNAHR